MKPTFRYGSASVAADALRRGASSASSEKATRGAATCPALAGAGRGEAPTFARRDAGRPPQRTAGTRGLHPRLQNTGFGVVPMYTNIHD